MLLHSKHSKNSKQTKQSQNTFKLLTYRVPMIKMYYALLMTVVNLGGQANAGIAASLKLLRAVLNLGSHLLSLFPEWERPGIHCPRSPRVGGKGGLAVAIALRGMQLEQPVLLVELQSLLWSKWCLRQSDPGQGGLGLEKQQQQLGVF